MFETTCDTDYCRGIAYVENDDDPAECETCRARRLRQEAHEAAEATIEAAAAANGWRMSLRSVSSSGTSYYYELSRETADGDVEIRSLRISDHGDRYGSTDWSVDPENLTAETVAGLLAQPPVGRDEYEAV